MNSTQSSSPGAVLQNAVQVQPDRIDMKPLYIDGEQVACAAPAGAWTCDLQDHLIFPGLINAHDHLHLNVFTPLAHLDPFPNSYAWIAAFQCHLDAPANVEARAVPAAQRHWHGALKNLLSGVTTVAHHDPWHPIFDDPSFPVRVLRHFGWSHSLGLGLPDRTSCALCYGPDPYTSFHATPATQPWIIHLAEGTDAVAAGELDALEALGCLAANTVLVHGVGLTERDIDRILAQGAGVVWCPGSNLAMLGRTLNPGRLLAAGRLALGSDSRISGSGDLLDELRLAAAHSACAPSELLRLATEAGSRLLSLPSVGRLAPGKAADLLIVRAKGADPYQTLLSLCRAEIRAVARAGRPALADSDFADWFAACGIPTTPIRLDGHPKLCDSALLGPPGASVLEPGLEMASTHGLSLTQERKSAALNARR